MRKRIMYATHELGAERNMMSGFVRIRDESDDEREMRANKVVFLFRCAVERKEKSS